jgi:GNAT superfamily N-acetyltransferase
VKAWKTRPYQKGDERAIADLVNAAAASPFNVDRWHWLFTGEGHKVYAQLAWDGDRCVGQSAVYLQHMRVDGQRLTWGITVDTATHPDYGRRGIFTRLAKELYQRLAEDGISVVYGLPNEQSSHAYYKRLGRVPVNPQPRLWMIGEPPAGVRNRLGPLEGASAAAAVGLATARGWLERGVSTLSAGKAEVAQTDTLPTDLQPLCEAVNAQPGIHIEATPQHLAWRYVERPQFTYTFVTLRRAGELVGLAVVRLPDGGGRAGFLMDFLVSDPSDRRATMALVSRACSVLHGLGATSLSALAPAGSTLRHAMIAVGFLPIRPRKADWVWTLGARVLTDAAIAAQVYEGRSWHVGLGVHDQL